MDLLYDVAVALHCLLILANGERNRLDGTVGLSGGIKPMEEGRTEKEKGRGNIRDGDGN